MQKFRMFITVLFLLSALVIILLIAVFDHLTFLRAVNVIKDYIWLAGIATLIFIALLSAGVVANLHRSEGSLISNGYFQLAILELFLFSAALGYFWHYANQPGQILFRLNPETTKHFIRVAIKYQSAGSSMVDTVRAPGALDDQAAGKYSIETVDPDIVYFRADFELEPGETEKLEIPVILNVKSLVVQTEPTGADIWINGVQALQTPSTFNIITGDTVVLELKMPGYEVYTDTISMHEDVDLGVIPLQKLFTLRISSRYEDIAYRIYDTNNNVVFSSYGSRKVQLAQGRYRIFWEIGEGQYESKGFSVNYNSTVTIP